MSFSGESFGSVTVESAGGLSCADTNSGIFATQIWSTDSTVGSRRRLRQLRTPRQAIHKAQQIETVSRLREDIVTKNLYYEPRGTVHYNVHFKSGSFENRVTERAICGLRPVDIDWIWIVEPRRRATSDEIRKLCKLVQEM